LENLHKLPKDWLIDPAWKGNMINPSRCAIMLSDQWATVSKSYREDLLNSSNLSPLLR
jgi:glycosyltransferase involved in cell wall biosynthesis